MKQRFSVIIRYFRLSVYHFWIVHCYFSGDDPKMLACGGINSIRKKKRQVVGRLSKRYSGSPGGQMQSKPTCWTTLRCSDTSAFLFRHGQSTEN
jgi:hypothetical protein